MNREWTRMKTKKSPQKHRGHRAKLIREDLSSLWACRTPEVDSTFIRVHSLPVRRSLSSVSLLPPMLAKSDPFAVSLLSASICVHLRLSSLFAVESWEVQA